MFLFILVFYPSYEENYIIHPFDEIQRYTNCDLNFTQRKVIKLMKFIEKL